MRKKWVILCAVITIVGIFATCFLFKTWKHFRPTHQLCIKGPYFGIVPTTDSSAQIPCIEVEIEGKTITVKIDLGSSSVIELPRNFLKGLGQKALLDQESYYGIRGKKYYSDIYEIPKIQIGGMSIYQARAEEINPEFIEDIALGENKQKSSNQELGRIGWGLFYRLNVLLDCENNKIVFCDSLDTLKKRGYPVDSFVETPLLLDRNLIEFKAVTKTGTIRCMLDTGSTFNMLNKDLENGSNEHMIFNPDNIDQHEVLNPENSDQLVFDLKNSYEVPVFKIGKKDFGKTTFTKIKTPYEVDAIVGMEFLHSKLVFIDFPNCKIYFYEK